MSFGTNASNGQYLDNQDFVFKYIIIGDSGVGKSSLMHNFIYNKCKLLF